MDLLKGIKVVSFNHFLLGPVGMQFLADMGADVIAVEPIDGAFQRKWGGVNSKTVDARPCYSSSAAATSAACAST